jgi:hypothetical protein
MPIIPPSIGLRLPKIVYGSSTLTFTYPPVNKPGGSLDREATREDSITLTGLKQSIFVRTDLYWNLQMDFVPIADLPNWEAFIDYALQGNQFDYYPDATLGSHITYTLDDQTWAPKRAFMGFGKFSLRFRKV